MSVSRLPSDQKRSNVIPRVSWRTLVLMLELLVAVLAWQYLATAKPVQADAIWLVADGHTASSIQTRGADGIVATPVPATADQDAEEP